MFPPEGKSPEPYIRNNPFDHRRQDDESNDSSDNDSCPHEIGFPIIDEIFLHLIRDILDFFLSLLPSQAALHFLFSRSEFLLASHIFGKRYGLAPQDISRLGIFQEKLYVDIVGENGFSMFPLNLTGFMSPAQIPDCAVENGIAAELSIPDELPDLRQGRNLGIFRQMPGLRQHLYGQAAHVLVDISGKGDYRDMPDVCQF